MGFCTWAFNLDHFKAAKPILSRLSFFPVTFILQGKFLLLWGLIRSEKNVFFQLHILRKQRDFNGWGIKTGPFASLWVTFILGIFKKYSLSYWEANSYYLRGLIVRKGRFPNSRIGWDRGELVPGASKLDNLQPFKPILFLEFSICFTFILGGQFLLPQRANSEEGAISQFQNWMRQGTFSAWGIQTGPIATL